MKDKNFFKDKKILVTGGAGFLGKKIVATLIKLGAQEKNILIPRSREYDLQLLKNCEKVVKNKNLVIHCAAVVGGIGFNKKHPAKAFFGNITMGVNLLDAAYRAGVKKFVMTGTVCEYPKFTPVPFREENLWLGYPEETNAPYGIAKKAVLVQGQAYRQEYGFNVVHLLLENLYGPGDNFDPSSSHVVAALVKKIVTAKKEGKPIIVWGTGKATREFLYVDDAAKAVVLAAQKYNKPEPVNIGSGQEISIKKLVQLICRSADYSGKIIWDKEKPDGQPRRAIDVKRAKKEFGFKAKTNFKEGIRKTIDWYLAHYNQINIKKPR